MNGLRKYSTIVIFVSGLFLPAFVSFVKPNSTGENRALASFPNLFSADLKIEKYPGQVDAWTQDNFGFRAQLIKLNNKIRYSVLGEIPSAQIVFGKNNRVFLGSHSPKAENAYSAILQICGVAFGAGPIKGFADSILATLENYEKANFKPKLVFIPSAPRIYFDELPTWIQQQCSSSRFMMDELMEKINESSKFKNQIYYPLSVMQSLALETDVYAKTWFHWHGLAPKKLADETAANLWQRKATGTEIKVRLSQQNSDVGGLYPGIKSTVEVQDHDFENTEIKECRGPRCLPEDIENSKILDDVTVIKNPGVASGRLILITDSFGAHIAPWYAPYFREIIHINSNNFGQLSKTQLSSLRSFLFVEKSQDSIQFLYHDGSGATGRFVSDSTLLGFETARSDAEPTK